jgi:hypothetical protein
VRVVNTSSVIPMSRKVVHFPDGEPDGEADGEADGEPDGAGVMQSSGWIGSFGAVGSSDANSGATACIIAGHAGRDPDEGPEELQYVVSTLVSAPSRIAAISSFASTVLKSVDKS